MPTDIENPTTAIECRLLIASLQHRLRNLDAALLRLPQNTPLPRVFAEDAADLDWLLCDVTASEQAVSAYLEEISASPHLAALYSRIAVIDADGLPEIPERPAQTLKFVPAAALRGALDEVERQALAEIEDARWPGPTAVCPRCAHPRQKGHANNSKVYVCPNCYGKFHVFTRTPFEYTRHTVLWWRKALRLVHWDPRGMPTPAEAAALLDGPPSALEKIVYQLPDWVQPLTRCAGASA